MEKKAREITGIFEGPIWPVTLKLALPMLIGMLFQFLYIIIDTAFIAQIDRHSTALLSGTGLIFPINFLFMAFGTGISIGVSTLVARGIGEKNLKVVERAASSGLLIAAIIATAFVGSGLLFASPILHALAGSKMSEEAIQYGLQFLYFFLPGLGTMLFNQVLMGILQGEGLNKYIAIAMMISTFCNIILDPIFIFWLKMGVGGASLASSIAIMVAGIYCLTVFKRKKSAIPLSLNIFNAELKLVKEIIKIGFPQSVSMLSTSMAFIFLNNIVSSIGQSVMNAWTLTGRMDQIIITPIIAISGATITLIGQNYGRQNLARVRKIYKTNIMLTLIMVFSCALLYNLIAPFLFGLFTSVNEVIHYSVLQVRYLSFPMMGIGVAIISSATFQATGRPIPALILSLIRIGIVAIPIILVLEKIYHLGITGVFVGLGLANIMAIPLSLGWALHHLKTLKFKAI